MDLVPHVQYMSMFQENAVDTTYRRHTLPKTLQQKKHQVVFRGSDVDTGGFVSGTVCLRKRGQVPCHKETNEDALKMIQKEWVKKIGRPKIAVLMGMHVSASDCMPVGVYVWTCACVCFCVYVCMFACMGVCACGCGCICLHMCVCVCECIFVCISVFVCRCVNMRG